MLRLVWIGVTAGIVMSMCWLVFVERLKFSVCTTCMRLCVLNKVCTNTCCAVFTTRQTENSSYS